MNHLIGSLALVAMVAMGFNSSSAAPAAKREQRIAIAVTSNGFEPSMIHLKAGRPVRLVVTRRTDNPEQVLADNVLQQRGLAGTGGAEHDGLHNASSIGPEPRPAMHVIAKHDCVLFLRRLDGLTVFGLADK